MQRMKRLRLVLVLAFLIPRCCLLAEEHDSPSEEQHDPADESLHESSEEEEGAVDDSSESNEPGQDLYEEGHKLILNWNHQEAIRGYDLLQEAASVGNTQAKEDLGYGYVFGNVLEHNFTKAFEIFTKLADEGSPAGQQGLGFMFSNGIGVNSSQAKAVLYYSFAALGGHANSQMVMGYRAINGFTVVQSCETALSYYYQAANTVVQSVNLITGGEIMSKVRLLEEENEVANVYTVSEEDMMHYHDVFSDSGNTQAQVLLGNYLMHGFKGMEKNFMLALRYLQQAADDDSGSAYTMIGKIYLEGGYGVTQDFEKAIAAFEKGTELGNGDSYAGLGMMYLHGTGVNMDYSKALEYFENGARGGSSDAQYYLGFMYFGGYGTHKDYMKALKYFQIASHGGHIMAVYFLAEMHSKGIGLKRSCNLAVELFKSVAERGKWTKLFHLAHMSYVAGDDTTALLMYLFLSDMGFEVAQSNAAYILEQELVEDMQKNSTLERALGLWTRAAAQGYAVARVKLGDHHYYGYGTEVNYEAAAGQYRIAGEKLSNPQAMFNLGYMYEQGLGLQKDYDLAKRYYDMAAESSSEALLPVSLALTRLNLLFYYKYIVENSFIKEVYELFEDKWDLYILTILVGLLLFVILWRCRQ